MKICKNNCIFCFISQLPKNLRPTLYIKDDDYFQSFTKGNFITLTNLKEKDIGNIIKFKIEPLYVSIHSFNKNVRDKLFGNNRSFIAIEHLKILDENKIRTNIQIVSCPEINDWKDIENTLNNLILKFNKIQSIGIVPVGITKYNRCKDLKSYNKDSSKVLIEYIEEYKKKNIKNKNAENIYLSDEFYIMAEKDFPDYRKYGRFLQIQNGIGKSTDFLNELKKNIRKKIKIILNKVSCDNTNKNINTVLVITSEYGIEVLKKALKIIDEERKLKDLQNKNKIELNKVYNNFFGGNIKATGLITGDDIIHALKKKDLTKYTKILVPDCIFSREGLTLDDYNIENLKKIDKRIKIINETSEAFFNEIFNLN